MINTPAFNQLQFFLEIKDVCVQVLRFESRFSLGEDYYFNIEVLSDKAFHPTAVVNHKATLKNCVHHTAIHYTGIITSCIGPKPGLQGFEYTITLQSFLFPLTLSKKSRVFIQKTPIEIIKLVLAEHLDLLNDRLEVKYDLSNAFNALPPLDCFVQYEESNYDFLNRLLTRFGVFYFFEWLHDRVKLVVVDDKGWMPASSDKSEHVAPMTDTMDISNNSKATSTFSIITFHPKTTDPSLFEILPCWKILTNNFIYSDHNPKNPRIPFVITTQNKTNVVGLGQFHCHGENFNTHDLGVYLSSIKQQSIDWQRLTFTAKTTYSHLKPNDVICLESHPDPFFNQTYRIIEIFQKGDQTGCIYGKQGDTRLRYENELLLIKHETAFRKPDSTITKRYQAPLIGTLESGPNETGCYYFRFSFDNINPEQQASPPTPQMQPLIGKISAEHQPSGFHFANLPGQPVQLVFVNGDINRPIITGALFKDHENIINNQTKDHHKIVTPLGHILQVDDTMDHTSIILATPKQENYLKLNATKDKENIEVVSKKGELKLNAGTHAHWTVEGDLRLTADAHHITDIHENDDLRVKGNLEFHSGNRGILNIEKDCKIVTKQQLLLQSKQGWVLETDALCINTRDNPQPVDGVIETLQRHLNLEANQIYITASEKITFEQLDTGAKVTLQEGMMEITSPGTIHIAPQKGLELKGKQHREGG